MSLVTIILLAIMGTSARADVKEPPYEPSGWKPSGAAFLLPIRKPTTQTDEQFPPLAPPPTAFTKSEETGPQFITPAFQAPTSSSDRHLKESTGTRFQPVFTPNAVPESTRSPSPSIDRRLSPENHNNRARLNQDNQPFVHKSESVFSTGQPLQGLSQYDDQTRPLNQNQSPFPKQYLPPSQGDDGNALFTDLSPPDDNIANYSTSFADADQASLTDSESPSVNNRPLFSVNNGDVSNRPTQEYGVPSLVSAPQNSPRIFFVVLPVRQATSTSAANAQTLAFPSKLTDEHPRTPVNQATPQQRFPRRLL